MQQSALSLARVPRPAARIRGGSRRYAGLCDLFEAGFGGGLRQARNCGCRAAAGSAVSADVSRLGILRDFERYEASVQNVSLQYVRLGSPSFCYNIFCAEIRLGGVDFYDCGKQYFHLCAFVRNGAAQRSLYRQGSGTRVPREKRSLSGHIIKREFVFCREIEE